MISFGTGGWRAIIGDDFTKENVQRLTLAVARRMKTEECDSRGFAIGYDRRFLSRQAAEWAAEIMASEQVHTLLINREAPTPLIMFTVQYYGLYYGMAVTASHNPALYNGIKLFTKGGAVRGGAGADHVLHAVEALHHHGDGFVLALALGDQIVVAVLTVAHQLVVQGLVFLVHLRVLEKNVHDPCDGSVHCAPPVRRLMSRETSSCMSGTALDSEENAGGVRRLSASAARRRVSG